MNTPIKRSLALLLALMTTVVAAGCGSSNSSAGADGTSTSQASSDPQGVVNVAYIAGKSPYGIEAWGVSRGIFAKYLKPLGIGKVKFVEFGNGPNANAAQASGAIDIALVGALPAVTGKAGGLPTRLLGVDGQDADAWLIAKKGTTVSELAGKTIGLPVGSYIDQYAHQLLALDGLTGKVKIANVLPPAGLAALSSGQIAAYAGGPNYTQAQLNKLGLAVIDHAVDHTPSLGGIDASTITTSFAAAHPGFAKAWNQAVVAARADAIAHSTAFYQAQAAAEGLTLAQSEQVNDIKATIPENQLDPANLKALSQTASYVVQNKIQPTLVSIQSWILDPSATGDSSGTS